MAKAVNSRVGRGCATALGCDYQGREFGAQYPDSVCIDGYLWDADSGVAGDDGWVYTNGGDLPCPQCNHDEYREYHADSVIEDAYIAASDGKWPFAKPRWKQDRLWMWRLQLQGVFSFLWDKTRGRA